MNRLFLCLINVVLATSFVGCVSLTSFFMTEKKCKEMNAHEYGRKTALQQICLNTFNTYKEKCAKKYQINLNQKEFDKGYKQGIKELCTEQGGYKFGRSGKTDRKLCPKKKQPSFLKGYKKGRAEHAYWQAIRSMQREQESMQRKHENLQRLHKPQMPPQ